MIVGIIIGVIVIAIIAYLISLYNSLVKMRNTVEEAFSTMDVYLKQRWDLVPNLVETVKGYAKHEKDTLTQVLAARSGAYTNMSTEEKIAANKKLTEGLGRLFAVAEAYPQLQANESFQNLQSELSRLETDIANSRKYYNGAVRAYNDKVQMFPNNMFAGMFKFTKKEMFEIEEKQRENVKVSF